MHYVKPLNGWLVRDGKIFADFTLVDCLHADKSNCIPSENWTWGLTNQTTDSNDNWSTWALLYSQRQQKAHKLVQIYYA